MKRASNSKKMLKMHKFMLPKKLWKNMREFPIKQNYCCCKSFWAQTFSEFFPLKITYWNEHEIADESTEKFILWEFPEEVIGNAQESRKIFVVFQIYDNDWRILTKNQNTPKLVGKIFRIHCLKKYGKVQVVSLTNLAFQSIFGYCIISCSFSKARKFL